MRRTRCISIAGILLCSLAAAPRPAIAGEAYYMLILGSQRIPNNPNHAHSFATFVHATWPGDEPCATNPTIEAHTISWLPQSLVIRTLALLPECGQNSELRFTIGHVLEDDQRVSMWGPYEIESELYRRAVEREAYLHSGAVLYKAVDTGRNSDRVANCIHAVSSIAQGMRLRVASPGWGESASFAILGRMRPWILNNEPHYWVSSALGLDGFPIIYRDAQGRPWSGGILGPAYRLLGGERNLNPSYGPP